MTDASGKYGLEVAKGEVGLNTRRKGDGRDGKEGRGGNWRARERRR